MATPWPPGARFVPADYDPTPANLTAAQSRMAPLLRLGSFWLAEGGPAAAAAAAPAGRGGGPAAAPPAAKAAVKEEGGEGAVAEGVVKMEVEGGQPGVEPFSGAAAGGLAGFGCGRRAALLYRAGAAQLRLRELAAQRGLQGVLRELGGKGA